MPSEGQVGLGEYTETTDRPTAEARAIVGADEGHTKASSSTDVDVDGTIECALQAIDYTLERTDNGEETPIIHIFARTPEGESEHIRVRGMRPYFYVPDDEVDTLNDDDRITGTEDGFEAIDGTSVTRVYAQTPRDVGQLREGYTHFEADVRFPNRFLIDAGVKTGLRVPERRDDAGVIDVTFDEVEAADVVADPRVLFFDIEVDDRRGFPEDGEEPIISIAAHDSVPDRYLVWLYEAPAGDGSIPEELGDFEPLVDGSTIDVRTYQEEEAMLDDFLGYVEDNQIDLFSGWNFDDFDAPYLLDRLDRLDGSSSFDLSIERLSRVDEVWRSNFGAPDIKGRVVFDLLYAYRRTQFTELDSYRLDDVGEVELGVGKERYPGSIGDLWEEDPERLLEYNVRDVELCVELNKKQEVIAFWDEVRQLVGCQLEDAPTPGDTVDMYILHKVHGDYVLPSRGRQQGEDYEGGAVFDPISGIRENVGVFDLKCFTEDTEVVTPNGISGITDLEEGDPVYTLDPETFGVNVSSIEETHAYPNKFERIQHLDGRSHDFKITENHRLLVCPKRPWDEQGPEDFEFKEFQELPGNRRFAFPQHEAISGENFEEFSLVDAVDDCFVVIYSHQDLRKFRNRVPESVSDELDWISGTGNSVGIKQKVGKYLLPVDVFREHRREISEHADRIYLKYGKQHRETPTTFQMLDWIMFLGWYVTEGSTYDGKVTIHQQSTVHRSKILTLLDRMGLKYNFDSDRINISNRLLAEFLKAECGQYSHEKHLPSWIFDLDHSILNTLLNTIVSGDGSWTDEGLAILWTSSEQLMEDFVRLGIHCGKKPTVTKNEDETWYISLGKRGSVNRKYTTEEPHNDEVYCITTDRDHVILAGRNGKFQWIGQSLYPMCMRTINASPETKVDPNEYMGATYQAPNDIHFRKTPDGIIRSMVDELLAEREKKKRERDRYDPGTDEYERLERQQQSVKVIMNSTYGVLGWSRFRLYDKDMGAAVTATGREVIRHTKETVESFNKSVIYGDTDSVMLTINNDDFLLDTAVESAIEVEDQINDSYDEFAKQELNAEEHFFEIEFEKLYRRFFQAGKKKRYAGHIVWKEGKSVDDIDITGFEYQRSDIAQITKEVQHEVLERIVREGDVESVKEYLHDTIEQFESGEFSPEEIAIPGGIGKRLGNYETDTAHVRGAKYANLLLGTNFDRGSKPKRLYLRKVHPDYFTRIEDDRGEELAQSSLYDSFKKDPDVICFEYADQLPEEFEIDWSKMLDKTLKGPISRILEALDLTWEEVKAGQTQTGLGQF